MVTVRIATLDDTAGIVEVHQSNEITENLRKARTIIEKWKLGGPWMALETCAIHLNYILNTDYFIPFVAEKDQKIIGEAEILIGTDADYGKHIHISVIYVHKEYQGQGVGSQLINRIIRLAQERGIHKITVNVDASAKGFYIKHGFLPFKNIYTHSASTASTESNDIRLDAVREIDINHIDFDKHLSGKSMCIGNYQSSRLMWFTLTQERYAFYPIKLHKAFVLNNQSFLVLRRHITDPKKGYVYMWGKLTPNTLDTVKNLARNIGLNEIFLGVQKSPDISARYKYVEEIWYKNV